MLIDLITYFLERVDSYVTFFIGHCSCSFPILTTIHFFFLLAAKFIDSFYIGTNSIFTKLI